VWLWKEQQDKKPEVEKQNNRKEKAQKVASKILVLQLKKL